MNKKIFLFLVLIFILWIRSCDFFQGAAWGLTPIDKGVGARALAMGEAFAGLAEDGAAIFINPAGLASIRHFNLIDMYSSPLENKRHITLGCAFPNLWGGTVGIGYNNLTTFNVLTIKGMVDYYDQEISLSYSRKIGGDLALGGNLRLYLRSFSEDISPAARGSGQNLDLALKYCPREWLGVGVNLQNVLSESLGGKYTRGNGETEGITFNFKAGISVKVLGENSLFKRNKQDLFVNLDLDKSSDIPPSLLHFGIEWWPVKFFALRGGIDQKAALVDSQVFNDMTLGFGLKYAGFTFDYAYYQLGEETRRVEHYFSLGYVGREEVKPPAEIPVYPTPESVAVKKIRRLHFTDVVEKYWAKEMIELLATAGVLSGYPDGTFRPGEKVTRAEFETMVALAKHLTPAPVADPDKFITRAEAAEKLGIREEIDRPDDALTRAEAAAFFWETPFGQAAVKRLPPLGD